MAGKLRSIEKAEFLLGASILMTNRRELRVSEL